MSDDAEPVSCLILAGGQGKRVGGHDKGLIEYRQRPLIEHVIDRMNPQVDDIVISANRNIARYRSYSDTVIADTAGGFQGPLAGIHAALPHCAHERVLIVPCDTPLLPADLVARMHEASSHDATERFIVIAETAHKLQPVMLASRSLHDSIGQLLDDGERRLMVWVKSHHPQTVTFTDSRAFKSFNHHDDFDT